MSGAAPRVIRLQFVLGAGLSSRLIAWYGQGYGGWSHVDAVLSDGSLLGARSDWIKGIKPGVRIRPPKYETWIRRAVVEIRSTEAQAIAWEEWLRKQEGCPYDQGAIWAFITGKRQHTAGRWICSACQFGALEKMHILHPASIPPSQVTPDTLFMLTTSGIGGRILQAA